LKFISAKFTVLFCHPCCSKWPCHFCNRNPGKLHFVTDPAGFGYFLVTAISSYSWIWW